MSDLTGTPYWDAVWDRTQATRVVDPFKPGINHYIDRQFHAYFSRQFAGVNTTGMRLLEIGCANSAWLPYFNRTFGFTVAGVDYSEVGVLSTRRTLQALSVEATIV